MSDRSGEPRSVLFRNAIIWDGHNDDPYPGEVLVEGNRIRAVACGPGQIGREAAAETIDCGGMTLMLATDLRFEVSRSHVGDTSALDGAAVKRLFDDMEAEGMARLRASFAGPIRTARAVDMRYGEQVFEISVPLDDVDWSLPDPLPQIVERFHRRHEALYTYAMPEQESVLVNARVTVAGILDELPREPSLPAAPPARPAANRSIYLDGGAAEAPVYDFDALAPGQTIAGPALVESAMTTVLLRPGDSAQVTPLGWLDISLEAR